MRPNHHVFLISGTLALFMAVVWCSAPVQTASLDLERSYNIMTNYSGRVLNPLCWYCNLIGGANHSACSVESWDQGWNNGTRNFLDPLDKGFIVSQVETTLIGSFSCLPGGSNASLQLIVSGVHSMDPAEYSYGSMNDLQVWVTNHRTQDICLSFVNVTIRAERAFPVIAAAMPNLASRTSSSTIVLTVDYLNPKQKYSCFFIGAAATYMSAAVVENSTSAICATPPSISQESTNTGNNLVLAPTWASPRAKYNTPIAFTFYQEPTLTSVNPNKGKAGDFVTISGSGFMETTYMLCRFGEETSQAIFYSEFAVKCAVPVALRDTSELVEVSLSLNGQDFAASTIMFSVESGKSWFTSTRVAIILGSCAGGLLLIGILVSIIIYVKKNPSSSASDNRSKNGYRALPNAMNLNTVPTDTSFGIDMSEVKLLEKIGRGSFGDIYKAEWRGTEVAIKKIPVNTLNEDLVQEMLNEARIMESIRHPNVLSLMGCCPKPPEVCIIMEFMPRGSLYQILQDSRIPLSWQLIQRMALDAARGMNFLHQHNPIIMHRDLKSHNLLVDDAWRVKVADFGLSRMIEEKVSATMTVCGTPCWTAPEVLRNQRYSVKADVYSFGICMWELYTRTAPYSGMTPFQVMFGVASNGMRPPINDDCPPDWRDLMTSCWSELPDDRPDFDEVAKTIQNMTLPETGGFH